MINILIKQKRLPIIIRIISIIITIIVIILFLLYLLINLYFTKNKVLQSNISPDGRYEALIFEKSTGALGSAYCLEILKNGKKINALSNGNVFSSRDEFSIRWIDNDTLYVSNSGISSIYRQKTYVKGKNIRYSYLKIK